MHSPGLYPGAIRPLIFGHRGNSSAAPENTMEAFSLCRDQGIDGIEFDVHLCASGELVVSHDFNVRRVTGHDGIIEKMTYEELRSLDTSHFREDIPYATRMPLLREVFDEFGKDLIFDLEMKSDSYRNGELAGKIHREIVRAGVERQIMVSSFNPFAVRSFRSESRGSIPTAVIYCVSDDVPKILQKGFGRYISGCSVLKPDRRQISEERFRKDSSQGYPVITWTVDEIEEADRICSMGVDGVISNRPDAILQTIEAYRSPEMLRSGRIG